MLPLFVMITVLSIGAIGMSNQQSSLVKRNKALKKQVVILKGKEVPTVKKLDGVEIKNLQVKKKELPNENS